MLLISDAGVIVKAQHSVMVVVELRGDEELAPVNLFEAGLWPQSFQHCQLMALLANPILLRSE